MSGRLAGTAVAGATLVMAGIVAAYAESPDDTELLAACANYQRLEAAFRATAGGPHYMFIPDGYDDAIRAITDLPARSLDGLAAKAKAILTYREGRYVEEDENYRGPERAPAWSLILDVAGKKPAERHPRP